MLWLLVQSCSILGHHISFSRENEINYIILFITVITLFNQCYSSVMNQAGHRESERGSSTVYC